jgi:hypothetical protein
VTAAVRVYNAANTTLVADLTSGGFGPVDAAGQNQLNTVNECSVTIPLDHPNASALALGNVVRFYDDSSVVGSWIIEEVEREEVSPDEHAGELLTASGSTLLGVFRSALVRPWVTDPTLAPQSDRKAFNFASPQYDASGWSTTLYAMSRSSSIM